MRIWFVRAAAVWLLIGAWWECAYSVLPFKVDPICILGLLLLFSCVCNGIFAKCHRWYVLPAVLAAAAAVDAAFIIWNKKVFISVLNHIANTFMKFGAFEGQKMLVYDEAAISVIQRSAMTALILMPLVLVFSAVLWYGKGKTAVAFLCGILPLVLAWQAGFPKSYACWMLILAAGVYFSIAGIQTGREAWIRAFATAAVLLLLIAVSAGAGIRLNKGMTEHHQGYYKVRAAVQANVVDRVTDWVRAEDKVKEEQKEKKDKPEENNIQEQEESPAVENPVTMPWDAADEDSSTGFAEGTYGELYDLADVERFSPNPSVDTVVKREEKPDSTVYEPLWYGGYYEESTWDRLTVNDQMVEEYSMIFSKLTRLAELCKDNPCRTPEEADAFITRQFEEHTVYDYEPGKPPAGVDFAEYFLFDNQKGFCVHFATTATLMYRIYGIPARYAEGYAVPADAFTKQADGSYAARVTGEMGHAWCEIYVDKWIIKEHTLPYRGPEKEERGPASDMRKKALEQPAVKILLCIAAVVIVICLAIIIFFIQAAVRRKKLRSSFRKGTREAGVQNMYRNIYDTAVFLGMDREEPLTDRAVDDICAYCHGITKEELLWMKEIIQEILFYDKAITKQEFQKACQIHDTFAGRIKEQLFSAQKLKYRYIYCLA